MQGNRLFSGQIYTAGTNFTRLLVATIVTNLNSVEILFLDNSDGDSPFRRDFIDLRDKNGDLLCLAWVGSWHQTHPDLSSLVYFKPLTIWRQVSIPLVYTQLVTMAVNVYFLVALFGRQYLTPTK